MKRETEFNKGFDAGYICAVATLVKLNGGSSTDSEELLRCNRPKSWKHIEKYDIDTLRAAGMLKRKP